MGTPVVTSSWDDGHPLDLRLAELLQRYKMPATFYVPVRNGALPVLGARDIRAVAGMGMEIGSHTVNHTVLTGLPSARVRTELRESKCILEDIIGQPVSSFCYPRGYFDAPAAQLVTESGYRLGRTTVAFRTNARFAPAQMPVTLQMFRHPMRIHFQHALKDRNFQGLLAWRRVSGFQCELVTLAEVLFEHAVETGGVFHLWGHSWEIEEAGLWGTLEEILKLISHRQGVSYRTNSGVLDGLKQ
jgi:hypothetical protein